ncbi:Hint domain-containing protein [Thioclava sp. GXIMD4215]|uniref:Hint domain-containing protein n=1 Tax=Thioclava sp. GXIMD4215 TaxID=3131928 RepID=UPI00324EF951
MSTTYTFVGYSTSDFQLVSGGYRLRPDWEASTNGLTYTFTDDDSQLSGDTATDNVSNDNFQHLEIRDSSGTLITSGTAYIEDAFNYTDPSGNPQVFYTVKIGNTIVGYLASSEIQPGVVMSPSSTTNTSGVNYSAIHSASYSSTGNNTIIGASNGDSLAGGTGDDSITSNAGADTIDGGAGNDTIYYGQGGASSLDGDSVRGGDGDDIIDDISGTNNWTYNDTIDGGAGNDTIWSNAGADSVLGGTGNDVIYGEGDNDTLYGGDGNDFISGGTGNDLLYGDAGNDTLLGDEGNDTIHGGDGADAITGGSGNDSLDGGADADVFFFGDGWGIDTVLGGGTTTTGSDNDILNFYSLGHGVTITSSDFEDGSATDGTSSLTYDNIEGYVGSNYADSLDGALDGSGFYANMEAGDDTVQAGAGDDTLFGGDGNDSIDAGAGNDYVDGGAGNDTLRGGAGNDTLWGGTGQNQLYGDAGDDLFDLRATDGASSIYGGADFDTVSLSGGAAEVSWTSDPNGVGTISYDGGSTLTYFWDVEKIDGTSYDDQFDAGLAGSGVNIDAGAGADKIDGSAYADTINTGTGDDTVYAGAGDDIVYTDHGNDVVYGEAGDDYLHGGAGNTTLDGGDGNDTLIAGTGANSLSGGAGNDSLVGSTTTGQDTLDGGEGNDTILAGQGANLIYGGTGDDLITTGDGADTLGLADDFGSDIVTDFDMTDSGDGHTVDQLDVSALTDTNGDPVNAWDVVISSDGAGGSVLSFPNGETLTLQNVDPSLLSTAPQLYSIGIPCIAAGMQIATPEGPRAIETLRAGDFVQTQDKAARVLWVGRRDLGEQDLKTPRLLPIEIRAGSLGAHERIVLSGQHCVWLRTETGPRLIRARHLADCGWQGARIMRGKRQISYIHLLLETHSAVRINGLWVESFWPGPVGFQALSRQDQISLLRTCPQLAPALLGNWPVQSLYGPQIAPVLARKMVTPEHLRRWRAMAQPVT